MSMKKRQKLLIYLIFRMPIITGVLFKINLYLLYDRIYIHRKPPQNVVPGTCQTASSRLLTDSIYSNLTHLYIMLSSWICLLEPCFPDVTRYSRVYWVCCRPIAVVATHHGTLSSALCSNMLIGREATDILSYRQWEERRLVNLARNSRQITVNLYAGELPTFRHH